MKPTRPQNDNITDVSLADASAPSSGQTIASFVYDEATELLTVTFADGSVGNYHKAPRYMYLGLQCARSPEKFWREIIQPRYHKVPVYRLTLDGRPLRRSR